MKKNYDFIIAGAGIMGLALAKNLLARGHKNILILEKEKDLGCHASGRNSGVLHAGIYYGTDSFKAKFCSEGSKALYDYAEEH